MKLTSTQLSFFRSSPKSDQPTFIFEMNPGMEKNLLDALQTAILDTEVIVRVTQIPHWWLFFGAKFQFHAVDIVPDIQHQTILYINHKSKTV